MPLSSGARKTGELPTAGRSGCRGAEQSTLPDFGDATDGQASHGLRRRRKKPRAFETMPSAFARRPNTGSLGLSGAGVKLSTIPNVAHHLRKAQPREPALELLHRVLFNSQGMSARRVSNIRKFSGFVFRSEIDRVRTREKLARAHSTVLRRIAAILDVPVPPLRLQSQDGRVEDRSTDNTHDSTSPNTPSDNEIVHVAKNSCTLGGEHTHSERAMTESVYRTGEAKRMKNYGQTQDGQFVLKETQKEAIVTAIMNFLEKPEVTAGRESITQRGKSKRVERKALKQVCKDKEDNDEAHKLEQRRKRRRHDCNSDSEGIDEDIETNALPWIEIARRMREDRGDTPTDGNATRSSDASNSTV